MFEKILEIETLSIVFLGDFNPIIFQPFWLYSKGLIRENEATDAKVEVIHNEVVKFDINDWASIEVTKNRCEFKSSKKPYFEPLKDLASSIFKILRETPLKSFGINHIYDCKIPNEELYIDLGRRLTPLELWGENMNDPRLNTLEIMESNRIDGEKGNRRIRITPSDQKIQFGVTVNINNHFDLKQGDKYLNAISQLEKHWADSFKNSELIASKLFTLIQY